MKNNKYFILTLIIVLLSISILFVNKKENIIKDLTFNQIEDKRFPLNYRKEYTFIIKELKNKENSMEFNVINHYVEVYISDKLVYKLDEDKIKYNNLIKIPLNRNNINKKVKIVLTPLNEDTIDNNLDLEIK